MSWSLALSNGDFTLNGAQLGTVSGGNKLLQDMRCSVLEPMGTDDMHPDYGSLFDGGVLPDGTSAPSIIGSPAHTSGPAIGAELQRLATYYRNQQLNRAKSDQVTYNRVTLTPAEVLISLSVTNLVINQDSVAVAAALESASGQGITLAAALTNNP